MSNKLMFCIVLIIVSGNVMVVLAGNLDKTLNKLTSFELTCDDSAILVRYNQLTECETILYVNL